MNTAKITQAVNELDLLTRVMTFNVTQNKDMFELRNGSGTLILASRNEARLDNLRDRLTNAMVPVFTEEEAICKSVLREQF